MRARACLRLVPHMRNSKIDNSDAGTIDARGSSVRGFTLLEVLTALTILAFVSSSVLLVINRSIASAADSAFRMEAFQMARENMEKILVSNSVSEMVEYGTSERYPDISWRTVVEAFSEPVTGQTWARAVCSADYTDPTGETQTVELIHWIAQLTEQQASQLVQDENLDTLAAEQFMEYIEDAALYAGVEAPTIEQWLENGLVTTTDGAFIKHNLDIFARHDGNPTDAEKAQQVATIEEMAAALRGEGDGDNTAAPASNFEGETPMMDSSGARPRGFDIGRNK